MKPLMLTFIRLITAILEVISPRLAVKWTSKLFFSPRGRRSKLPNLADMEQSWMSYTKVSADSTNTSSQCRVYASGQSDSVILLVHGWEACAKSLSPIAQVLLKQGHRVVLFDLPAHGFSPGKRTNMLEISHIIQKIAKQEGVNGHLCAIIGHSFGAAAAGHAIKQGVSTNHFVSIAAPTEMDFILDQFCTTLGASATLKKALIHEIESILQGSYQEVALTTLARDFNKRRITGIIAHDRKDRLVPFELAEKLAETWSVAKLVATTGYGHNRILKNPTVIKEISTLVNPKNTPDEMTT